MSSLNKIMLIGNLGKDPEMKEFGGRKKVVFPLATTEVYKDRDGKKVENTTWHNVGIWEPAADVAAKYLKKGYSVYVEGRLDNRRYQDPSNPENVKYYTQVTVQRLVLLNNRDKQDSLGLDTRPRNEDPSAELEGMPF